MTAVRSSAADAGEASATSFTAYQATDVGTARSRNEDFVLVRRLRRGASIYHVLIVADGIGGRPQGDPGVTKSLRMLFTEL